MATMLRSACLLLVALAPELPAQQDASIAGRITQVTNAEVRMTFASRSSACGDGRDAISIGDNFTTSSTMESYGRWSGFHCVRGPARVRLMVRDRQIDEVRTSIGGSWPAAGSDRVVDLGVVPARDAAEYFLSLAKSARTTRRSNPLLAAAVADSANVSPAMLDIARTTSLPRETRRRAMHWAGALGDASAVAPLVALARASEDGHENPDDMGPGDGMQGAAVGALAMIPDDAGIPALMELARKGSSTARKAAVFWLGQGDSRSGRELVRTIAADDAESETLRGAAIFALGQGREGSTADDTFLRNLFGRLTSERLKDRVLMSVSQRDSEDGARWLLAQARDDRQPMEVRRKAVFWAGQGHATVADLTWLYGSTTEARLREHIIFVLSQRGEESATSALMSIARGDSDREMRRKALFWLAQKDDPRVTKLISDLVSR